MGISLVEHEVVSPPGYEDDDEVNTMKGNSSKNSNKNNSVAHTEGSKKKVFKSVCILTEYLDLGNNLHLIKYL